MIFTLTTPGQLEKLPRVTQAYQVDKRASNCAICQTGRVVRFSRYPLIAVTLLLASCDGIGTDDLEKFVAESGKDMQGKVEPLPQIKPYEPFTYEAFDLPDPFKPRKLSPTGGGGLQPDFSRPKEPLEAYSLETLKMVGVVSKKGVIHAVVATPNKGIYHVHVGNYMGQNFGLITKITETEIKLREIVQNSAGDWTERTSVLTLQE